MKKAIALLIGATFAGVTLAQTPAPTPTTPPVQTPRAATPAAADVKPPVQTPRSATPAMENKRDKAVAATTKTQAKVKTRKPRNTKAADKANAKADVKADTKAEVKKP